MTDKQQVDQQMVRVEAARDVLRREIKRLQQMLRELTGKDARPQA